jgi:acetyl esterase/lipase
LRRLPPDSTCRSTRALKATRPASQPRATSCSARAASSTCAATCIARRRASRSGWPRFTSTAASPTTYVARGYPPTVLFHDVADSTIPIESSQRFFQLLRDAEVPSELHSFAGAPHSFDRVAEFAAVCTQLTDLFIDRYVINPRPFPSVQEGRG